MRRNLIFLLLLILLSACKGNLTHSVLFEDEFKSQSVGVIALDSTKFMHYHFDLGHGRFGQWSISSFSDDPSYLDAWKIDSSEQGVYLEQQNMFRNNCALSEHAGIHPIVSAGDTLWSDVKIDVRFSPNGLHEQCGVLFRVQNDHSYYFYGMVGNRLVLKMVDGVSAPGRVYEEVLASVPFDWKVGKVYKGDISLHENKIYTLLNDSLSLYAEDFAFSKGKVGFLSDVPAKLYELKVTALGKDKRKYLRIKHQVATQKAFRISENPMPVKYKEIDVQGLGTGNNLRFGDMNADGEKDILIGQVENRGGRSALSCMTAISMEGDILWQVGQANDENYKVLNDVPMQVHDLDGDGSREVVAVYGNRLGVYNGKTGRRMRHVRAPGNGSLIYFCDLKGVGWDSDVLFIEKDKHMWVYDSRLRLQWDIKLSNGYYPDARDLNGDGKDEILLGDEIFTFDEYLERKGYEKAKGSVDASVFVRTEKEGEYSGILRNETDWGLSLEMIDSETLRRSFAGEVRGVSLANFRNDLEGEEILSVNYFGGRGLLHMYDSKARLYMTIQLGQFANSCWPVNWKGDGEEYFLLNMNSEKGGLFNGLGEQAVGFPDDGHPELANAVVDLTGDVRDEIVCWDQNAIWIYTQQEPLQSDRLYEPVRTALYNFSLHAVHQSIPFWSSADE